jgi:hypothetical protein
MFNEIENLDVFLGIIEADEDRATRPIFVKILRNFDQNAGLVTGSIMIQTEYDTGMVLLHNYTDGMDPVVEIPMGVFNIIKHYYNEDKVKEIQAKVTKARERLESQINSEHSKLLTLLSEKGFSVIIDGVWTQ